MGHIPRSGAAIQCAGSNSYVELADRALEFLDGTDVLDREAAIYALATLAPDKLRERLPKLLQNEYREIRVAGAGAASKMRATEVTPKLMALFLTLVHRTDEYDMSKKEKRDLEEAEEYLSAVVAMDDPKPLRDALAQVNNPNQGWLLVAALEELKDKEGLIAAVSSRQASVGWRAVDALVDIKAPGAGEALVEFLRTLEPGGRQDWTFRFDDGLTSVLELLVGLVGLGDDKALAAAKAHLDDLANNGKTKAIKTAAADHVKWLAKQARPTP